MSRHAQMKYVGGAPLITVLDKTVPLLSSNVSDILVDDWIDLAEWGVLLGSATCYLDMWTEKFDGGEWKACIFTLMDGPPPGMPALDPQGYTVLAGFIGDDLDTNVLSLPSTAFNLTTEYGNWAGTDPCLANGISWTTPTDFQISRVRAVAKADCSSGVHDALNYRLRMRLRVPDFTVWEKEVAIPATDATVFLNEDITLTDLGLCSDNNSLACVALIRRGGKTIRVLDSRQTVAGGTLDPPTYPIMIAARTVTPELPWYEQQNSSPGFYNVSLYGGGLCSTWPYGVKAGGSWRADAFGQCTSLINDTIKLYAWREGPAYTTYLPAEGASEIAVPGGSADGCTLLVKIFRAPIYLRHCYPFNQEGAPWILEIPGGQSPDVPAQYQLGGVGLWQSNQGRLTTEQGEHARLSDLDSHPSILLETDPHNGVIYEVDYNGDGTLNYEQWKQDISSLVIKRNDFTYSSGRVSTIVTKVYDGGGIVLAQTTTTNTYNGSGILISHTCTRDI